MLTMTKRNWRWSQEYEVIVIRKTCSAFQIVFFSAAIFKIKGFVRSHGNVYIRDQTENVTSLYLTPEEI